MGRRTRSDGFTLLEVMIALSILAVVLVAVSSLRNRDLLYQALARDMTTATFLAQHRLGQLEVEGFPALGESAGGFDAPYDRYKWVQSIAATPFEFAREVRVSVHWRTLTAEETVELISYVMEEK